MKSSLNLYQAQFRPHFVWMTLSHLSGICFVLVALLFLVSGFLQQENANVDEQLIEVQTTLSQQRAILDEMSNILAQRTEDPELIATLTSLSSNIQGKETLLARLEELDQQQSNSFSNMLTSLAKIDANNVWLTRIQVIENDLNMQGVISSPNALPLWIRSLSDTEYFANRTFREAHISRDEQQLVFSLATKKEGG
jgi:MSHA biogenesis protein MshI